MDLESICVVDGSVACGSPSTEEAANIWPEAPLEILVSVGMIYVLFCFVLFYFVLFFS
jgi:hypothetical protein